MKCKVLALVMVLCFVVMSAVGCSSASKTAIVVGDIEVSLLDVENAYQNYYNSYSSYLDLSTEDACKDLLDYAVESLIYSKMEIYQASLIGITLTDEEIAEAEAAAEEDYQTSFQEYVEYAEESGSTDARATANETFTSMLVASGLTVSTYKAKLLESEKESLISEKFQQVLAEQADVSEENVRTAFDSQVEVQKSDFEEDPAEFYNHITYNSYYPYNYCRPLYVPSGFVRGKVIVVTDEATADDILAQLEAGADFDELYTQYNEVVLDDDSLYADGYYFYDDDSCPFDEGLTMNILGIEDGQYTSVRCLETSLVDGEECYAVGMRICQEEGHALDYDTVIDDVRYYLEYTIQSVYYSDKMDEWCTDESLVTKYEDVYADAYK